MKKIAIVSAIALASVVGISTSSQAATYKHVVHTAPHHACVVKTVKRHVHGHWVVSHERVCR